MTLGPALIAMSWLDRLHFAFTNPLSVFGRVPFFYYAAHLLLAHAIAIVLNFARYGQTPFLWVAPPSMGGPTGLFPSNYGFPLWVVYAVLDCCSTSSVSGLPVVRAAQAAPS